MCLCGLKRDGSVYEQSCETCVARRVARSPRPARTAMYAAYQRDHTTAQLTQFKAAVKHEWELDHNEKGK
jgi:hypothetical protein